MYTAVSSYIFVAMLAIAAAVEHDRPRPKSIASVAVFMLVSWVYVVLHFATHTVAFIKVFTGTEGKWEVTTRSIKGTSPAAGGATGGGEGESSGLPSGGSSWLPWARRSSGVRGPELAEPLLVNVAVQPG